MKEVIKLDTVDQYNRLFGLETLHPLVSIVNLSEALRFPTHFTMNYGVYALFLKNVKCGDIRYGRQTYDYQEGTVTSFAPGQVVEVEMQQGVKPNAHGLLFHPDLIKGTSLGQDIKHYSFFSYTSAEALHLSEEEKGIFIDCLEKIKMELQRPIDKHSKRLISRNIELLLDYCARFNERQFITRCEANKTILHKTDLLLSKYILSGKLADGVLPTEEYCADAFHLSPRYFSDLLKFETGKSIHEYFQLMRLNIAKRMLLDKDNTVHMTAKKLGYANVRYFTLLFKKITGITPAKYKYTQN